MANVGAHEKQIFAVIFTVSVLCLKTIVTGRECCPQNTYLVKSTKMCSDNETSFDLNCPKGSLFLDYILSEEEKRSMGPNESFSVFEEGSLPEDKFCVGKIDRNGTDRMVALICFDEEWTSQPNIILRILMLISTLFLLATLYVYVALPNLRDLQGKCVIAFIACLISSYITLLAIQTFPSSSDLGCVIQGGPNEFNAFNLAWTIKWVVGVYLLLASTLYFSISATFFWNNIITFNIWKAVRNAKHKIKDKSLSVIYLLWGFGVPVLMVAISFILDHVPEGNHIRPHFGEIRCWFKGKIESWSYFYGPISVLLVMNTIMFLQSVWILWKSYKVSNNSKLRSLRFKYLMYLKLFLMMGITWTFEVISFAASSDGNMKYVWFITDCLNSAQGILIFLIMVVFRQKVRLGILKHKLLNISWPQSWAKEDIQESSIASLVEEFELPNQKSKMIVESQK